MFTLGNINLDFLDFSDFFFLAVKLRQELYPVL
ncbi:hypothetical protein G5O_0136 [Chlamydia psittaci 6BC]|nr:hypothetical protein G5O_0136 [Chlamydia psittaci 6BC]